MSNEIDNYLKFEGAGKLDLFNGKGEENVEFSPACYDVHTIDENTLCYVSRMVPNLQLALEVLIIPDQCEPLIPDQSEPLFRTKVNHLLK